MDVLILLPINDFIIFKTEFIATIVIVLTILLRIPENRMLSSIHLPRSIGIRILDLSPIWKLRSFATNYSTLCLTDFLSFFFFFFCFFLITHQHRCCEEKKRQLSIKSVNLSAAGNFNF